MYCERVERVSKSCWGRGPQMKEEAAANADSCVLKKGQAVIMVPGGTHKLSDPWSQYSVFRAVVG